MGDGTATVEETTTSVSWGRILYRWGLVLIIGSILIGSVIVGCQWRRFMWDYTQQARFRYDVGRNYMFGREAKEFGYLNVYENQVAFPPGEARKMNYPPLRFATFTAWAYFNQWYYSTDRSWNHPKATATQPSTAPTVEQRARADVETWREEHEFSAFVMYFNTFLEFMAATAALLLVRHWIWRTGPPESRLLVPGHKWLDRQLAMGWRPVAAFLLLWLNPAMILSAHGWPSWDMWVIPFFLWTVLLCCWEYWFAAGVLFAIGAMFKGQQLSVAVIFVLWPIMAGQPGRALRFAAGFVGAFGLLVSGWMLTYRPEIHPDKPARVFDWAAFWWVASCAGAVVLANGWRIFTKWFARYWWAPAMLVAAYLIVRPAIGRWDTYGWVLLLLAGVVIASAWAMHLWKQTYVLSAAVGVSLLLCMVYFHGTDAWWELGYRYGTERHMGMIIGPGSNLAAILESRFQYYSPLQEVFAIPAKWIGSWPARERPVLMRELLISIYVVFLLISTIAIARQWRKNDRRFLVAVVVPWLLFYSIPAQIHERYLLFGSGIAAIVIGCSVGLSILNLFLVALTFLQTAHCMMFANNTLLYRYEHRLLNPDFSAFCDTIRPDIGWAVLAATLVFMVAAFARSRWRRPVGELAAETTKPELAATNG